MNAHLIRPLLLGVFAFPLFVSGQVTRSGMAFTDVTGSIAGTSGGRGSAVTSGMPGSTTIASGVPGSTTVALGVPAAASAGVPGVPGQGVPVYSDPGNNFFSNVPINELNAKAYRRFHRRFRDVLAGEYWFKYTEGYQVSFTSDQHHAFAYYNPGGTFLYSLRYYDATGLSKDLRDFVTRRFPEYTVDVVTEVNDGVKTFYMLQIMNPDHIKVVTITDGRVDVVKELTNGSAKIGHAEAAR